MEGRWETLWDKFYLTFFPVRRVVSFQIKILSFKQLERESLGVAWARFTKIVASGPDLRISEPILLQYFSQGLNIESAAFLDSSFEGPFDHLTHEGMLVLDKLLENNPYTGIYDEFPEEISNEPTKETITMEEMIFLQLKSIDYFSSPISNTLSQPIPKLIPQILWKCL